MAYLSSELYFVFPSTTDCATIKKHIDALVVNEDYWRRQMNQSEGNASNSLRRLKEEQFKRNTCELVLGTKNTEVISKIGESYDASAKAKIETDTNEAIIKRLIIGASIIVLALGILLAFKKKEE